MADGATPNYALVLIEIGASRDTWGDKLNANMAAIDAALAALVKKAGDTIAGTLVVQGIVDVQTPNNGSTGGLRVRANGTTGLALVQITTADATAEYGYWRYTNAGIANWKGIGAGGLQVGDQTVWHAGNFNPAGYAVLNSSPAFTGAVMSTTPSGAGTTGGVRVRANSDNYCSVQFLSADGTGEKASMQVYPDGAFNFSTPIYAQNNLVWHAGNFDPSQYALNTNVNAALANYALNSNVNAALAGKQPTGNYALLSGADFANLSVAGKPLAYGPTRPSFVVTDGTAAPSGGADGDMYFQYS